MRVHPVITMVAVAAATLMVSTGCVAVTTPTASAPRPASTTAGGGLRGGGGSPNASQSGGVVQRALSDVERYWTKAYPGLAAKSSNQLRAVSNEFQPVRGGYHPYTRTKLPPRCGSQPGEYQPNAFYCPPGDFIAWDAQTLIPELNADYGPLLVGVVVAHEYGHAIQSRLGLADQPTIVLEQQADCFAGSWVGDVLAGHSKTYRNITAAQLDSTVAGLLQLRDQPGTSAQSPQAHGNAFDRVRAFQDGVERHASRCAKYRLGNPAVTEVQFSSAEEAASGGELATFGKAVELLSSDVQDYWRRTYPRLTGERWRTLKVVPFDPKDPPACSGSDTAGATAFYCASDDFVAFDARNLGPTLYTRIGDNAVGMLLGGLFAQAVQERRGRSTDGRTGQFAVDCLAGTWTFDLLHRSGRASTQLSPGDLDEAVTALLVFNRGAKSGEATAFSRIAAFRTGALKSLPGCS